MRNLDLRTQAEAGISAAQCAVLFVVAENNGCLQKEATAALAIDPSAMTHMVKRMQSAGVLEKRPCPNDGRATRLFLTPKGTEVVRLGSTSMNQVNKEIIGDFSAEELDTVARFLKTITHQFSTAASKPPERE